MPQEAGSAYIDVLPLLKNFQQEVDKAARPALDRVSKGLVTAGKAMTIGLTLPIVAFGKASLDAFNEAAQVSAQTTAVLRSTGGEAGVTRKQIESLATTIQDYSGVADESVQQTENLLLTFTNLRNEAGKGNDVFNQTTQIAVDMSKALGQDLKASAIQLGKALNDPTKGITALRRVGVAFTQQQQDQINKLVKHGKLLEAQKIILGEVKKEFGGVAAEMGKTTQGRTQIALAHLNNVMEQIGGIIAQVLAPALEKVVGLFTRFGKLSPAIQKVAVAIAAVLAVAGPLLLIFGKIIGLFTEGGAFLKIGPAIAKAFAFLGANPWIIVAAGLIALTFLIVKNWDKIKAFLSRAWAAIKDAAVRIWHAIYRVLSFTPILAQIKIEIAIIRNVIIPVFAAIFRFIATTMSKIRNVIVTVGGAIGRVWHSIWDKVGGVVKGVWGGIIDAVKIGLNAVIVTINALIRGYNLVPFHADVPTIPHLARGTRDFVGGMALVGEAGAELVQLPPHSRVTPLHGVAASVAGGQVIRGVLRVDPRTWTAYIEGVATDQIEDERAFRAGVERMGA